VRESEIAPETETTESTLRHPNEPQPVDNEQQPVQTDVSEPLRRPLWVRTLGHMRAVGMGANIGGSVLVSLDAYIKLSSLPQHQQTLPPPASLPAPMPPPPVVRNGMSRVITPYRSNTYYGDAGWGDDDGS
jgi:hypothetical protein